MITRLTQDKQTLTEVVIKFSFLTGARSPIVAQSGIGDRLDRGSDSQQKYLNSKCIKNTTEHAREIQIECYIAPGLDKT